MASAATPLSAARLRDLDPRISVPTYDRALLAPRIVHIGVGGFHRSHQAAYLDELLERGLTDWAIAGAGVLPGDSAMADALRAQDHLYCLVTRDRRDTRVRVVGSIVGYVLAVPSPDPLASAVADPRTRIVSLTVTEGGYPVTASGEYAVAPGAPAPPAFAAVAEGLQRRRDRGQPGIAVLSCDNVVHNGAFARAAVLGAAADLDPQLPAWVADHVTFPASMVDRITPATTDEDRAWLAREYGVADRWPVVAETFTQWVIEDDFPQGRPPWQDVGVLMTDDVAPYEQLKLRILNAGHSCLAYLAALDGMTYVHEAATDAALAAYLRRFFSEEAVPALPPVAGVDVAEYADRVVARFSDPQIRDTLARVCGDGSAKLPKFLIPTVEAQLDRGGPVRQSALALAAWCQYLLGTRDDGRPLEVSDDPLLHTAMRLAAESLRDPRAFLAFDAVFGPRLPRDPEFVAAFSDALTSLRSNGVRETLARTA
ncbi:MAG: mannitol dehydrogenase family protein [Candidatus Nanopelagicales bacterium]